MCDASGLQLYWHAKDERMSFSPDRVDGDGPKQPMQVDVFYAMITLASTTLWSILGGWLLYFYLPPEQEGVTLVPVALYGAAMFVTRVVNALITPPIGYLSDHTRTGWGRRLPFMGVSALPMLVLFVLSWTPPVQGESIWNLVYLAAVVGLYNIAYVLNQVPYMALLPELARTDHHRVRISAWTSSFMLLGMIVGGVAGPLIEHIGFVGMSLVYAVALLPLFYLPFLVLRERQSHQIPAAERLDVRQSLSLMWRNRAFRVLTASGLFYWGITSLIQAVIPYIVTEVCLLTTSDTMLFYVPAVLASLLCYPLVMRLADLWGKRIVFRGSLVLSALVLPGLMAIGDWLPLSLKAQGIAWITMQSIAMSGIVMLQPAMGAEVTDYDEELSGQRREGSYYATWGLLDQVINGMVLSLLPLLLTLGRSHLDPRGPLGVRLVGIVGGVMMGIAFLIFLRYPSRGRSQAGGAA
jgi:GPH family glycoside/pentoside/hexuronide:cation symporter